MQIIWSQDLEDSEIRDANPGLCAHPADIPVQALCRSRTCQNLLGARLLSAFTAPALSPGNLLPLSGPRFLHHGTPEHLLPGVTPSLGPFIKADW
jgi:hypothetical protein